ncbi:CLUMA_CG007687, isoform A [Clunio marinus]|uniref:RING-type E3 ubiquitin transferase n=1 Tax=Clunio marinus TaxID=568069 RepID=A0A1J1I1T4_9DIPT|nr:CLUMA_CG007687, isoform A [Clunio marinus]
MSTQEEIQEPRTKSFFCHSCQNEFRKNPDQDFTCSTCSSEFIEELPESSLNPNADEQDESQFMRGVFNDFSMGPFDMSSGNNNTPYYRIANEILGPIITGSLGGLASTSSNNSEPSDGSSTSNGSSQTNGSRRRGQRRQGPINFEEILQEILVSITDGPNSGRTPMFFMGNPGDYAWGREGLDTIVTQLLNQMDNAGPPPLDQEKIAEIPKCEIVQEQIDSKLQCSVCWEDFQLKEIVRQLPCSHVYHEPCILPWLKLHGTCPICRKLLAPEDEGNANNAAAQVATQLRFSIGNQASSSQEANNASMDTTNHSSNSNENPSGSSSNRRRDDIEFDFD